MFRLAAVVVGNNGGGRGVGFKYSVRVDGKALVGIFGVVGPYYGGSGSWGG